MISVEEEKVALNEKGTELLKYKAIISGPCEEEFSAWLLSQPHSPAKDKLFEETLLTMPPQEESITYYQMSMEAHRFEKLMARTLTHSTSITTTSDWYRFESEGHFYIDYAHPTAFGGGFRSFGNVQEETLFVEFPKLAHLAFATQENPIRCIKETAAANEWEPTPFLVPYVERYFILHDLYGSALDKTPIDLIPAKVERLAVAQYPSVHILGMAAKNWAGKNKKYTIEDLHYHLKAAFLAFSGAKMVLSTPKPPVIHTGLWGCGVFRNSPKTMVLLQALAACLAEVDIIFEGVDRGDQPSYTQNFIHEVNAELASAKEVNHVMEYILDHQEKDATWAPA